MLLIPYAKHSTNPIHAHLFRLAFLLMLHDLNGPVASDNFHLKRVLSSKRENLNFGHLNVCSLKPSAKHSSLDEVKKIMEGNYLDFLGISETWLKSYISNAAVSIPGYRIFRNDRPNKRGGGVALYVSCKFKAKVLSKSSEPGCEFIFVELMREQVKTVIGVFYLPNGNLSLIEESVSDISSRYASEVIMADFNHNLAQSFVACVLYGFVQSSQSWDGGLFLVPGNVSIDANPDIFIRDFAHVNIEAVL